MGYTKRVIAGFSARTFVTVATTMLVAVKLFILARLLGPEQYGIFSLTLIALGISEAFTATGINITIVQSTKKLEYFVDTAWVIAIIRGFLIAMVMVALGLLMQGFYAQPILVKTIAVAALVPIIKGFINPAIVRLIKELKFEAEAAFRLTLVIADALVAVAAGVVLQNVWALILGMIAAATLEVVMSFVFFSVRPRFRYKKQVAGIIFGQMKWLNATTVFNYLLENLDNVILGRMLGVIPLGLYHNGYAAAHKITYALGQSVFHGTLPVYVRLQGKRLRRAFLRALVASAVGVALVAAPIFVLPQSIVWLLGAEWSGVLPAVRWLLVAGYIQAVSTVIYSYLISHKHYRWLTSHQMVAVVAMVGFFLLLVPEGGLVGAGQALVYSRVLAAPILGAAVVYAKQ